MSGDSELMLAFLSGIGMDIAHLSDPRLKALWDSATPSWSARPRA